MNESDSDNDSGSGNEPVRETVRRRILVGVDGSSDGLRAVRYAMREARADGADLWVVNVVDEGAPVGGLWELVSTSEGLRQVGVAKVAEALGVLAEEGFPAERVTSEVLDGSPGDVLAELSNRAALVVVGRRSIGGLKRMFVGSTSVSAAAQASCPVIVVSAASSPQATGLFRSVAVAVSTWPVHESALEWAFQEAALRQAGLRVVHVVPETLGVEGAAFVAAAAAGLERHLGPIRREHPERPFEIEVLLGDPVDALVGVSKTVDLLILGLHHHRTVLSGAVRGVMAHSHCPVGLIR